ncbi:hypothetical protein H6F32_09195 [Anabaena sp. FACHB-1237]|nr:hypothetical protein [Anabaena sp. FACHB-1237]
MSDKNMEYLIKKIVKKVVKKELYELLKKSNIPLSSQLNPHNLPVLSDDINSSIDPFLETLSCWQDELDKEEKVKDIYSDDCDNIPFSKDVELKGKLRELKFKQELRKDWILFLVKDVIVYSVTILFMFIIAGFYLQQILSQ